METKQTIKKIPYGVSNYDLFPEENYYYIDKTPYIRNIEEKGLFLSLMENYYDIDKKDQFDELFHETAIGKDPTPEKNRYHILKFDFSSVDGDIARVGEALGIHVEGAKAEFATLKRPSILMNTFLRYCEGKTRRIYVIIDEFDSFANAIFSTAGEKVFQDSIYGESFFRVFGVRPVFCVRPQHRCI